MRRFHVHVSVTDLPQSIGFYSKLFGAEPTVSKTDYAKWMLDDPRINFAISTREGKAGLNHLGFQVDSADELTQLREQAQKADIAAVEELGATCCYAKSDKHWIEDPQGIAWETFHTLGDIPVFGAPAVKAEQASACCAPKVSAIPVKVQSACCG
ncbi:ArsI/CadI family heavy metal resistance metalloenzyme [Hydrocarboniphaga effusa]|jgi:hypothetical protein|uniref:ArsI/CadI family heavy metal resistance metalloenzyme n=1 Tax=Hydrocarboniphaga effusa TaxID=243629 RepID=UPI003138098F